MQAQKNAQLNLEENAQRKAILNSMQGTRVFRGSALSRAVQGNTPGTGGEQAAPAPSRAQLNSSIPLAVLGTTSLLDQRQSAASGNTAAGGTGASGGATAAGTGGYRGGSSGARAIP